MTVKQLRDVLNELPAEFSACEVEFGSKLAERDGETLWFDQAVCAVYANPDREDVVLCSRDVGAYIAGGKFQTHLREFDD